MFCFAEWASKQPKPVAGRRQHTTAIRHPPATCRVTARDLANSVALKQLGFDLNERRAREMKRRYGISPQEYFLMWLQQAGACAICRIPPRRVLYVDHCHLTNQVRGLICLKCNLAIGFFRDDPMIARKATGYLEAARTRITRMPRPCGSGADPLPNNSLQLRDEKDRGAISASRVAQRTDTRASCEESR